MLPFTRTVELKLYTQALQHNVAVVRRLAPHSKVLAMVKANAYGHGMLPCLLALQGHVDAFGVACMDEALHIRNVLANVPIVLIEGVTSLADWELTSQKGMQAVVHSPYQLDWVLAQPSALPVWLKVNTGMNRLGLPLDTALQAALDLYRVGQPFILTTHFANADAEGHPLNDVQKTRFMELKSSIEAAINTTIPCSAANSAVIASDSSLHGDWVRPGIMLYGASPLTKVDAASIGLQPAMSVHAPVIAVNSVAVGDYIGYGSMYQADNPMQVAVIGVGYGDGYPRLVNTGVVMLANGCMLPVLGRVSMDMLVVDATGQQLAVGEMVELWGQHLAVDKVAEQASTISYDLFCKLSTRVTRSVVE